VNWDVAHKVAAIAAVQAHRDLAVERTGYVDVFAALRADKVVGIARPMPRLFGVYYARADSGPGVLLNASLDIVTQRHTAAHELGHHRLDHRTAFDQELDRAARWGDGSWPDEEKTAEAFAAWFLMPPPAVAAALARIGTARPRGPEDAYQVARWLGTSYAGTVNHLRRLRLVGAGAAAAWLKTPPAALKSALAGVPVAPGTHVHGVGVGAHRAVLRVDAGDLVVLRLPGARFTALPDAVVPMAAPAPDTGQLALDGPAEHAAVRVTDRLHGNAVLGVEVPGQGEPFVLTLQRQAPRVGYETLWPA
jgi:Zn-dependent peptidase ImmA (M78 family)